MTIKFIGFCFLLLTISCSKDPQNSEKNLSPPPRIGQWQNENLRFIGEASFLSEQKIMDSRLGGISSLIFVPKMGQLLALSDDPGKRGPSRIFYFFPRLTTSSFKLIPAQVFMLKAAAKKEALYLSVDGEGIDVDPQQNIFISTEGRDAADGKKGQSQILFLNSQAELSREISMGAKFLRQKNSGSRENRGPEGLSLDGSGEHLYVCLEEALEQDQELPQYGRFLVFENKGKTTKQIHEYLYPRDAFNEDQFFGVAEIRWLRGNELLVLERWQDKKTGQAASKLYLARAQGSDVKAITALKKGDKLQVMEKKLLVDFSTLPSLLTTSPLGNLEGLSFGPDLENGHRTLILANDNHFTEGRNTSFLAFEVLKEF